MKCAPRNALKLRNDYLLLNCGARRTSLLRNSPWIILSFRSASQTAQDDIVLLVVQKKKALRKECLEIEK